MQSKPNSKNVIYVNFNGETIQNNAILGSQSLTNYIGWVAYANEWDIDGTIITDNNRISSIKVPPASATGLTIDTQNILKQLANKYDIFDVNVTDERGVYENASGFKCMLIVTGRPSINEFNQLTAANNRSENTIWPYSYRRFISNPLNDSFSFWSAAGLAGTASILGTVIASNLSFDIFKPMIAFLWVNAPNAVRKKINENQYETNFIQSSSPAVVFNTQKISRTAAHEAGHLFGLWHDSQMPDKEYYNGHNDWAPIMGWPGTRLLQQWSKGEYFGHVQSVAPLGGQGNINYNFFGSPQDDLIIIGSQLGFIKSPKNSISKTNVRASDYEKYELIANQDACWYNMDNLGVYSRVISQSDVVTFNNKKVIEGMIGFPGDFEIIKMVLQRGTYNFTIDPIWHNPESMLDINMQIFNCHCHKAKEDSAVNCNKEDLPTTYPENISSENFQCISFDNCLDKYKYDNFLVTTPPDNDFNGLTVTVTLPYTQIVYLRIAGDKQNPIENGWSVYSSVGKYYLEITKNGNNNPEAFLQSSSTAPLPVCNCEEYTYCDGGNNKTIILFTQEEGEAKGTSNTAGAHIKEYTAVLNGEPKTKKFLVYGGPLNISTDCAKEGKFCLDVYDSTTQKCVKQEFVVGGDWEKKKEIQ